MANKDPEARSPGTDSFISPPKDVVKHLIDGVELSELQGIEVKQGKREVSHDTGGTRTLQLQALVPSYTSLLFIVISALILPEHYLSMEFTSLQHSFHCFYFSFLSLASKSKHYFITLFYG